MKIDLIKETFINKTPIYYIEIDGEYEDGTATGSFEDAKILYEKTLFKAGKPQKIVLETTEI